MKLDREEFERRYRSRYTDPVFRPLQNELDAIVGAAWDAYSRDRGLQLCLHRHDAGDEGGRIVAQVEGSREPTGELPRGHFILLRAVNLALPGAGA